MKSFLQFTMLAAVVVFLSVGEFGFVRDADAIIGMPRTPLSVAGVARRSMYRAAVVSTVAVTSAAAANAAAANTAAANAAAAQAAAQPPQPSTGSATASLRSIPLGCSVIARVSSQSMAAIQA